MWKRHDLAARLVTLAALGLVFAATAAVPGPAAAAPAAKIVAHGKKGKSTARSIGPPNHGRLEGAARLRQGRTLKQREGGHSWGLPQLVSLLHHASAAVARKHRGSVMLIGDLSGRTGGHLDGHGSHQSGRDADVGFYVANSKNKPMAVKRFVAFDDAGNARDVPGAHFDEARNWTLVEALLKDTGASVRYLFVTNGLRARLLAYAAKKHAPKELQERAAAAMMSPDDADLHDDHFHVRISCPEGMRDVCIEEATRRADPAAADKPDADKPEPDKPEAAGDDKQP